MSALIRILAAAPFALAFTLLTTAPARASVIYTYTGNPFTQFNGPYNSTHRVTGFVEFLEPLGANLDPTATLNPVSFSFSDGVQTITKAEAPGLSTAPGFNIRFWTGANAEILRWGVNIIIPDGITFRQITTQPTGDSGTFRGPRASNRDSPGVWERQAASVPEPTSMLLIGAALAGFAARRRLR